MCVCVSFEWLTSGSGSGVCVCTSGFRFRCVCVCVHGGPKLFVGVVVLCLQFGGVVTDDEIGRRKES